jgi:hypothetical protein
VLTPSLMVAKRGGGPGRYSKIASGNWLDTWRSLSSEARRAISAWRRCDASPWRRRQDQNAKGRHQRQHDPIRSMAESVNCRDEATVMFSAAWAGDKAANPQMKARTIIDRPPCRHAA